MPIVTNKNVLYAQGRVLNGVISWPRFNGKLGQLWHIQYHCRYQFGLLSKKVKSNTCTPGSCRDLTFLFGYIVTGHKVVGSDLT